MPASSPTRPAREGRGLFGCLVFLLGLHRTLLKAAQSLARWKRSDRQFLASQAECGARSHGRVRGEGEGGWREMEIWRAVPAPNLASPPFHSLTHSHCPPFFPTASPPAAAAISDLRYRRRRRRKRRRRLRRIWCSPCCWPPSGRPSLCHGSPYAVLVSDAGKQHPLPPLLAQWLGR